MHAQDPSRSYFDYNRGKIVNPSGPKNAGCGVQIPMKGGGANADYYYAKSGTVIVVLSAKGKLNFSAYAAYGHNYVGISVTPTVSVPGGVSVSFSPAAQMKKMKEDWADPKSSH